MDNQNNTNVPNTATTTAVVQEQPAKVQQVINAPEEKRGAATSAFTIIICLIVGIAIGFVGAKITGKNLTNKCVTEDGFEATEQILDLPNNFVKEKEYHGEQKKSDGTLYKTFTKYVTFKEKQHKIETKYYLIVEKGCYTKYCDAEEEIGSHFALYKDIYWDEKLLLGNIKSDATQERNNITTDDDFEKLPQGMDKRKYQFVFDHHYSSLKDAIRNDEYFVLFYGDNVDGVKSTYVVIIDENGKILYKLNNTNSDVLNSVYLPNKELGDRGYYQDISTTFYDYSEIDKGRNNAKYFLLYSYNNVDFLNKHFYMFNCDTFESEKMYERKYEIRQGVLGYYISADYTDNSGLNRSGVCK